MSHATKELAEDLLATARDVRSLAADYRQDILNHAKAHSWLGRHRPCGICLALDTMALSWDAVANALERQSVAPLDRGLRARVAECREVVEDAKRELRAARVA